MPSSKGFVTDFVYSMRESEAPTLYCIWAALFAIASVIRREAWLKWFRGSKLYSSFYLFLIGPPSTKKSFVVDEITEILEEVPSHLRTDQLKKIKNLHIFNMATPEYIVETLAEISKSVVDIGADKPYFPGAASVISASELSLFLGKQKYNEGKVSLLLQLYDCRKETRVGTIARGLKIVRNVHTMFIAGTTKRGMADSVPAASTGDGFLSRTVMVNLERTFRRRPPSLSKQVEGAPSKWDIIARLAWIAENVLGEHHFSPEAKAYIDQWYERVKDNIEEMGEDTSPIYSRFDLDVVKIALLMKAQRYSLGDQVEVQDVEDSVRLVEATMKTSPGVVAEVAGDETRRAIQRICNYVERRTRVDRAALLRNTGMVARELDLALNWAVQAGKIAVYRGGERTDKILREVSEVYEWIDG